ncbi:unnamed protein product, partial [Iphiclides podalirius]
MFRRTPTNSRQGRSRDAASYGQCAGDDARFNLPRLNPDRQGSFIHAGGVANDRAVSQYSPAQIRSMGLRERANGISLGLEAIGRVGGWLPGAAVLTRGASEFRPQRAQRITSKHVMS